MPSSFGSWLSGPPPVGSGPTDRRPNDYPGQRLNLPQDGPKSLARMGRRIGALFVDWLIAYGLAALLMSFGWISLQILSTAVLVIWLVIGAVSVRLFGFTPGQYALGLIVIPVGNRLHVGFGRALARGLLIALVVPPLFTDTDLRGIHDRLTNTAVVRR
jgi:RDD family